MGLREFCFTILARDMLNRFYDGDPEDPYAVNDTGKPLGDLFAEKTSREMMKRPRHTRTGSTNTLQL